MKRKERHEKIAGHQIREVVKKQEQKKKKFEKENYMTE